MTAYIMSKETSNFVYNHWKNLTNTLNLSPKISENWWSVIFRHYTQEWRHYHSLSHIENLLQLFDQWRQRIVEPENVALAIFFHDIVYNPTARDNEDRSVIIFNKFADEANLGITAKLAVTDMIIATKYHVLCNRDDSDLCFFLDFDLAIMGQKEEVYREYSAKIRREYDHYDDSTYRTGRTAILQTLLNSPSLYSSEEMRQEFEAQARINMIQEIKNLQSKF
ncbi:unnamed protein product [Lymnaea stagnalis]|uniref:Metal-dependent HD superfamily phosphohydrolase n=1 Tax=Lymnaea stagnalis TaxID=6523 RepID=A0AAV2HFM1_LYMST